MSLQQAKDIAHRVKGNETDIVIALLEADREAYKQATEELLKLLDRSK